MDGFGSTSSNLFYDIGLENGDTVITYNELKLDSQLADLVWQSCSSAARPWA